MKQRSAHEDERAAELLLDRALVGLSESEEAELTQLLGGELGDEAFERAAAAITLSRLEADLEPLPADLEARILNTAAEHLPPPQASPAPALVVLPSPWRERVAWLLAAACFLLAVFSWTTRPSGVVSSAPPQPGSAIPVAVVTPPPCPTLPERKPPPSPAEERERLLADGGDVVRLPWSATKDAAGAAASGDVVWSQSRQIGYMRFHGLDPNDPKRIEYQLWIFDEERDDRYPVDGGVFDVDRVTGDIIVPIHAKVVVHKPKLFAITVEPPGGVVVSKRERIVLTASVHG